MTQAFPKPLCEPTANSLPVGSPRGFRRRRRRRRRKPTIPALSTISRDGQDCQVAAEGRVLANLSPFGADDRCLLERIDCAIFESCNVLGDQPKSDLLVSCSEAMTGDCGPHSEINMMARLKVSGCEESRGQQRSAPAPFSNLCFSRLAFAPAAQSNAFKGESSAVAGPVGTSVAPSSFTLSSCRGFIVSIACNADLSCSFQPNPLVAEAGTAHGDLMQGLWDDFIAMLAFLAEFSDSRTTLKPTSNWSCLAPLCQFAVDSGSFST